jgi:hypothetical protein
VRAFVNRINNFSKKGKHKFITCVGRRQKATQAAKNRACRSPKGEKMFFTKHEKKRLNPWCVIIVGGLAAVGAVSLVGACRDKVMEKGRAVMSFFQKKKCECGDSYSKNPDPA